MQIVINIPEWKYKSICKGVEASKRCGVVGIDSAIHEAIYHGTPLPKGHGRLKDVDKIISDGISKEFCDWYDEIKCADTIVDVDKKCKYAYPQ
jgi:hypothetical protein